MFQLIFCRTLQSQSASSVTMANLAAILRQEGLHVEMTLLERVKEPDALYNQILEGSGEETILLYKANAGDYEQVMPVLRRIKREGRRKQVILCGPFASFNCVRIMKKEFFVDGIILGTGEWTLKMLAKHMTKVGTENIDTTLSGGLWRSLQTGELIYRPVKERIPLYELPLPARDIEKYQLDAIGNLESSRGCNNRCYYCHMRILHDEFGLHRERKTVSQVMADIRQLYGLGKQYLIFNDSVFWDGEEDTPYVEELCRRIIASDMEIYFMVYLSLYHFPDESLRKLMYQAGLIRVFIGVESNNPKVLCKIKEREYPVECFESLQDQLHKMHISYHIGYMVFYPFSNMKQVRQSVEYLYQIHKMYRVGIFLEKVRLIPGTPLYQYRYRMNNDHKKIEVDPKNKVPRVNENKIDTAYDYQIADERAERLQRRLIEIFEDELKATYIQMELLCCGLDLILSICSHKLKEWPLDLTERIRIHREKIENYSELIHLFLLRAIEKVVAEERIEVESEFRKQYIACARQLTDSWMELLQRIKFHIHLRWEALLPVRKELLDMENETWKSISEC